MFLLKERLLQKYRTLNWPAEQPRLSPRYRGRPAIADIDCGPCAACLAVCPARALSRAEDNRPPTLDMGRCIFCGACAAACPQKAISFSGCFHVAAYSRQDLLVKPGARPESRGGADAKPGPGIFGRGIFGRSFKLREVSAGGCAACEADCNVLGTLVYDLGRFGVEFTASPRHADAIVLTGPVTRNMLPALLDAWGAVPEPRVLVAVGSCAISGGLFRESPACAGGFDGLESLAGPGETAGAPELPAELQTELPADFRPAVYVPGCPPNPWSILEGLLMARSNAA